MKPEAEHTPAAESMKAAWQARKVRKIRGVTVSFYKRFGTLFFMDFTLKKRRVKACTDCTTLEDAARVAERRIQELQEKGNGLADLKQTLARERQAWATVGDVLAAMETGDKVINANSARTYRAALKRLAMVAEPHAWQRASLATVLSRANIEQFYSLGQGRAGNGVNWINRLPCNGGLNSTIRNVRALFKPIMLQRKFSALKLPPLDELKAVPKLPRRAPGFTPWPAGAYEAMHQAALALRETEPELYLVNLMLRCLGLRNAELWAARRDWITTAPDGRAWLNVRDHYDDEADDTEAAPFEVLKHGEARRLELNEELKALLLPRTGWLIAPSLAAADDDLTFREDARHALIYRRHSAWLRQFIPTRRKSNHELRMYAGSLVAKTDGLEAASYFLGHSSIATTQDYYVTWLKAAPMLDTRALATAHDQHQHQTAA